MSNGVDQTVLDAARTEQNVELTTFGRVTGNPHRITISITPMDGRVFIYSRAGMGRDWTQNLAENGRGVLHFEGFDVPFSSRHLTDMAEARRVTLARTEKYGTTLELEHEDQVLPIETATFEALPVPVFESSFFKQAADAREVTLTTYGRKTGNPAEVIIWITPVGGSLYIRSGGGMGRDWTRNLEAQPAGALQVDGVSLPISVRHVSNLAEAKLVSKACRAKYGDSVYMTPEGEASPAETATFEVLPRID